MKQFLRISAMGLVALLSHEALAVQGNLQSSSGFVASTMGGATVAQFSNEFDAVIDNPALMQFTKTQPGTHRFSLGLEYANYTNSFAINAGGVKNSYVKGKLNTAWIPFAGYFYNINERVKFGTGIFAIGGTGYDYSNSIYLTKGTYAAISVPLAVSYKVTDTFNIGASLNIVLTQLTSNNFDTSGKNDKKASAKSITPSVGVSYALSDSLLLGADLALGTTSTFKGLYVVSPTQTNDVKIGTPLQFSIGVGQNKTDYSVGFKYRMVNWANTENYKQLGWKNQSTFSVGGQYNLSSEFVGRAGLYYVTSVYGETKDVNGDATSEIQGVTTSHFNRDFSNAMMYGIPQWQIALGGGYKISSKSIIDFGVVYEPETAIKFTGKSAVPQIGSYEIRKKNYNLQIFATFTHEV